MDTINIKKGGISILGILLLGVILILVLSYFNISIKSVVESPTTQSNISYVTGSSRSLWNDYLQAPASYLWNDVWVKYFWTPFISNMEQIREGKLTNMQQMGPSVNLR